MDQASADMEREAQKPQNQKNYENCPKHIESPVLIPEHRNESMMTGGVLQVCAILLKWAKAQPETGLINFDQLEPSVRTAGNELSCSDEGVKCCANVRAWSQKERTPELLRVNHLRGERMTVFSVFLIAFFLLISWLLCLGSYRGTERDPRRVARCHRH